MNHQKIRVALLDLNNNVTNRGIPYLKRLLSQYDDVLSFEVFDVRHKFEIPHLDFDIYISSGGPGSPFDFEGGWDKAYFNLIDQIWEHNNTPSVENKKFVFFICHSFQLACQYFKIGEITQRKSKSFGTFPCHKTEAGEHEPFFTALPEPFWIADFRDWQVINADEKYMRVRGFDITAIEKERPHVELPQAIMAIRFSDEIFGTQFHPEADAEGMLAYFQEPDRRAHIIKEHGLKRYEQMLEDLEDSSKIDLTFRTILPTFIDNSLLALQREMIDYV